MSEELQNKTLAEQIISKAMQHVVFNYNAFAPIASSFRIAYTNQIPTMGVDKYARLAVNPDFVVENQAYMQGIIVHEILHVFFGHTTDARSKLAYTDSARHNELVNIAEDCAINQFIKEDLPKSAIMPYTLAEMLHIQNVGHDKSAEYYYDLIMENQQDDNQTSQQLSNGMCDTDKANGQAMQDLLDKMGVKHITQEEVNDKVMDMATQIAKSQGSQYGALADFAREKLNPVVDWRPLLQATVRNAEKKVWNIHTHQTYKRISRRSQVVLIPKRYGHKISVALSFDTSGSITSEMVNQFLSEVQNCLKYSELKECSLWHISTYWYGTPEELEKKIEKVYESGGTNENCMSDLEEHVKADLYVHFSDGYHGDNFGFKYPQKHIEIIWDGKTIKGIRKEF